MPTSQTWSYMQSYINATVLDRVLHKSNTMPMSQTWRGLT
ncbi:hypothetical protein F383_31442 [Gossypium arboreum]|uniref:Uncharacterized protein n=1 Tax=Gossypium arboreum TaxID=29729 RepID=A0A0B0MKA6_GOSAR|nr:hypothetical protein F383_38376 [Gossypium arboreum]KHG24591.1 hypothetical protein F383_31442 [Gossypium arboreum]